MKTFHFRLPPLAQKRRMLKLAITPSEGWIMTWACALGID